MLKFHFMELRRISLVLTILLSLIFAADTVRLAGREFRFYAEDGAIYAVDPQNPEPYKLSGDYAQSRSPDAFALDGNIYLVWENAGKILFRSYSQQTAAWSIAADISGEGCIRPKIAGENGVLYIAWLQYGEAVGRACVRSVWEPQEKISVDANGKLSTVAGGCADLTVIADGRGGLHAVWANGRQLLYRARANGSWSGSISRLSADYQKTAGYPVMSAEQAQILISYVEKDLLVTNRYNTNTSAWEQTFRRSVPAEPTNNSVPVFAPLGPGNSAALEITAIEKDSMYLHSPRPELLYYSGMLQGAQDFIIRGKASGIRQITFSPAFGIAPPPLQNFPNGEWSARYSIQSTAEPADIVITAYDFQGNAFSQTVAVRKDTVPPQPPTWVRVQAASGTAENKRSNSRQVAVTWTDGTDDESGLRYHVLGTSSRWWQNAVHQSGETEAAEEGDNTFYVFAVDNVGNVSLPGTDTVFVNSIPPAAPVVFNTVTSENYFYGVCSANVTAILVNGRPDEDMEIITTGSWRYKHDLKDGKRVTVRLQALDGVQNKSPAVEYTLEFDRTPPQVFYAEHNADGKILRIKDTVLVTARAEADCAAFFSIAGVTADIPLLADGAVRVRGGLYAGVYAIDNENFQGDTEISVAFYDRAGNKTELRALKPLLIDSLLEQNIDAFEDRGDFYPWKNHAWARNITALEQTDIDLQIPEGQGVLRVDYDLASRQTWAGVASREFLPRNYYGSQPALQFWLKGSGSPQARLVIQLLAKNAPLGLNDYNNDHSYSVSLSDTQWKKYSLLLPKIADLDKIVKYAVYVHNADTGDAGAFYLDDLRMVYRRPLEKQPAVSLPPVSGVISLPVINPSVSAAALAAEPELRSSGGALLAPYIELELTPPILTRGKSQSVKVSVPAEIAVARVYVVWGRINQKLQTTKLTSSGSNVFQGEYLVPADLQAGEFSGVVFVQTADKKLYKKPFYYKVLSRDNAEPAEQISAQFFPQPLLPGKDIQVNASLPASVKSQQVVIFLGQDQSKVLSAALSKNKILSTGGRELWQGVFVLPEETEAGEYTANIFCKTQNGSFIKKKIKYSVQK